MQPSLGAKVMTREKAIKELKDVQETSNDTEGAHCYADSVLCTLLISLGYEDVVEAYTAVEPKWYA